ncbi:hypothetical protein EC988_006222 [Linderina pennispora]|nr:hypothetical protein EC988_006222 [Linderina pennispora]
MPFVPQVWVSDAFVNSAALVCVVGCSLMVRGWQAKLVLIRRIGWMMAVLYFLRSITISLTTLPPSLKECVPVLPKDTHDLLAHIPGSMSGQISACTDKIFSGHTAILAISFLFWTRYARHWAFIVYSAIHTVIGMISVLAVRYHYSIDVLLAMVLAFFVHHVYYTSLDRAILYRTIVSNDSSSSSSSSTASMSLASHIAQESSEHAYSRVQENDDSAGEQFEQPPANTEKILRRVRSATHIAVTVPAAADEEYLDTEYYKPGCMDANSIHLMAVNRPMSRALPRVVAWMDGLQFR